MGQPTRNRSVFASRKSARTSRPAAFARAGSATHLALLAENSTHFRTFVAGLADNDGFDAAVTYTNSKGEAFTSTVRQILTQLQLHAAYHRGQTVQLLKPFLSEALSTDYIFYARGSVKS
jgi:uncharacterized damage-inducible protein DinB